MHVAPGALASAEAALAEALRDVDELHRPGMRARHRAALARALAGAAEALDAWGRDGHGSELTPAEVERARLVQALAHEARAKDARHGAGQLSQSAQRAPTSAECDEGWRHVETIVATCETSAREATRIAACLDDPRAARAAQVAGAVAHEARAILERRNHAYTFHTDPRFSFGEGWYVAAAGVLAEIAIQIEPGGSQAAAAERFLSEAGLGAQLAPYRSRPRANKALPDLIARAFLADQARAAARLRAAFLGDAPTPPPIVELVDHAMAAAPATSPKVLVWVRTGAHHPHRNSRHDELVELCRSATREGLVPVLVGDAVRAPWPDGALDLTLFWRRPLFQGPDMRRAQLQLFERLRVTHRLVGQIGVTTAGMDGPALMGLPTAYLTEQPNPRLGRWVGAVPGYLEIVRSGAYEQQIRETFARWACDPSRERAPRDRSALERADPHGASPLGGERPPPRAVSETS